MKLIFQMGGAPSLALSNHMAYHIDPEFQTAISAFGDHPLCPARGDWKEFKTLNDKFYEITATGKNIPVSVATTDFHLDRGDGSILLRWYQPRHRTENLSAAVLYLHGGAMMSASVDTYDWVVGKYVEQTAVPFLSVDYRVAGERNGDSLVQDCFAALQWLFDHAKELGIDPGRIAVMGDSSGGALAAGVAILAREAGLQLARQVLIYPCLDDRPAVYNPELIPISVVAPELIDTMWDLLLEADHEHREVPPEIAPARLRNKEGLATAYVEACDLDLLCLEAVEYAANLLRAGVGVELHVYKGVGHGFDLLMPDARLTAQVLESRYRAIREI